MHVYIHYTNIYLYIVCILIGITPLHGKKLVLAFFAIWNMVLDHIPGEKLAQTFALPIQLAHSIITALYYDSWPFPHNLDTFSPSLKKLFNIFTLYLLGLLFTLHHFH